MRLSPTLARRQLVDRGLVQAGDRAERPGDQVQLVLNDQVRRIERPAIVERPSFAPGSAAP